MNQRICLLLSLFFSFTSYHIYCAEVALPPPSEVPRDFSMSTLEQKDQTMIASLNTLLQLDYNDMVNQFIFELLSKKDIFPLAQLIKRLIAYSCGL